MQANRCYSSIFGQVVQVVSHICRLQKQLSGDRSPGCQMVPCCSATGRAVSPELRFFQGTRRDCLSSSCSHRDKYASNNAGTDASLACQRLRGSTRERPARVLDGPDEPGVHRGRLSNARVLLRLAGAKVNGRNSKTLCKPSGFVGFCDLGWLVGSEGLPKM